jgi:glutathione S-transferase
MFVTMQCYIGDGCKETLASKALDRLELLAKTVKDNEYVAGDKLSCADFAFVEFVEMVEFISDGKVFETYPSLKQYRDGIFELPGLRDYIETRGHLSFNNKVAKINN